MGSVFKVLIPSVEDERKLEHMCKYYQGQKIVYIFIMQDIFIKQLYALGNNSYRPVLRQKALESWAEWGYEKEIKLLKFWQEITISIIEAVWRKGG